MRTIAIRSRILLVLGTGSAAVGAVLGCGSSGSSPEPAADAAPERIERDGSVAEAAPDASPDVADTGAVETAPPDGPPLSPRRPFLVGSSLRVSRPVSRDDWGKTLAAMEDTIDARTAAALARAWEKDALEEHASIAAFARFTMQLLSVGAPPELIVASQRASLDEVTHARECFALARRYGGTDTGPSPLWIEDALGPTSLVALAALATEEGAVGETLGALLAAEQLAHARDPEVVRLLAKIAADEVRHAELAWSFLRWAVATEGEPVRRAIREAVVRAVAETRRIPVRDYRVDHDAWHAHGRLSCEEARAVSERGIRDILEPCLAALLGTSGVSSKTRATLRWDEVRP